MPPWPFDAPPNLAVLTTQRVVEAGAAVTLVTHDADDGGWQFHADAPATAAEDEAMIVSLRSMIARDPTLAALADLPEGWLASREAPGAPWRREPAAP